MVISQIAGLATAFGTGELSGAGFGPNYTILMKLGYEFFAPRILEEMEKNPNIFFQDTLWFQKFQKQIKLYSDKVMKETLDTLLSIPQETIDSIQNKFQESLETGAGFTGIQGLNDLVKIFNLFLKASSANQSFMTAAYAAGGHGGSGTLPDQPFTPEDIVGGDSPPIPEEEEHGPPVGPATQSQILDKYSTYDAYRQNGGLLLFPAWDRAKFGLFKTSLTVLNQRIAAAVNVIGVFVTGATSHRRKTQSSESLRNLYERALQNLLVIVQTAKEPARITELIEDIHNTAQNLENHKFTYSI